MGFDPKTLPDSFRRKIAQDDPIKKTVLGKSNSELQAANAVKLEKELHTQFEQWLLLKNIPYLHARMDRRSTIQKGFPDFAIFYESRVTFIEFKTEDGELSEDQTKYLARLAHAGNSFIVTTDIGSAIKHTIYKLCLTE